MSGTTLSSADLDPQRRRLLFRAWHRGTREMDLLMGGFADARLPGMNAADVAVFEGMIEIADRDLFSWITGANPVPEAHDTALLRDFLAFARAGNGMNDGLR